SLLPAARRRCPRRRSQRYQRSPTMSDLSYDYQQYAILFVDDEEKTRKYFRRLYGETFRILEASDGVEALKVFREHADEIGIIVTDQRMPNETGVGFLSKISD